MGINTEGGEVLVHGYPLMVPTKDSSRRRLVRTDPEFKKKRRLFDRYKVWVKMARTWHEFVEDVKEWSEVFKSGYEEFTFSQSDYIDLDQA